MWTTLALVAALQLSPAQAGGLTIGNDRFTHGISGAARSEAAFLPGDVAVLAFDVNGVTLTPAGKVSCAVGLELLDSAGKSLFRQVPRPQMAQCSLGGNALHSVAAIPIPAEQAPGDYTVKLTFQDVTANATKSLDRKIKVLPSAFGLVQVTTTADHEAKVAKAALGVVGEPLYVNFSVVGFGRDAKKQPDVAVSLKILDAAGKVVSPQPLTGAANADIPADLKVIPMQFGLTLNRAGQFTIELTATDKLGGKSSKATLPLKVLE